MRRGTARTLLTVIVVLTALAVAVQIFLPPYLADRVEARLEEDGGSAKVSLSAFPAARLLFGDGDRIEIRGGGLRTELESGAQPLSELDGFDEVDVRVTDFRAGPFDADGLDLTRTGKGETYDLRIDASASARDLSSYAASRFGGPLGDLIGAIAGEALPFGGRPIPVAVDARVRSDGGRTRLVSGGGTVAGLPAGPLAEAILGAVIARL
jgi:hypothetical protein